MGRRSPYPEEFRKDTVALYHASGGTRTYTAVAADPGTTREMPRTWVRKDTVGSAPEPSHGSVQSPAEDPARLQAGNQRLLKADKADKERQPQREILRRAAAHATREAK
ncbi:transposase [Streptomyces sp. NPDC096311]|uniref:transposase n=1 Tax=Streptomyces sp. NPDC096311 TaxID=3366083 RepID=UPI00382EAF79